MFQSIFPIGFLLIAGLGCSMFSTRESPVVNQRADQSASPALGERKEPAGESIYSADFKLDAEIQARALVAFDRNQNTLASVDDPDVKKVKLLIEDLSRLAKEPPLAIRKGVQRARKMASDSSKDSIKNQELLEELAKAYANGSLGPSKGKFETVAYLWTTLRKARS